MNTALIFAAGRGSRMQALTEELPKPLLKIGDKTLIEYQILALAKAGYHDIVITVSYQAEKIIAYLRDGAALGVNIVYSRENSVMGTGGGLLHALPLLHDAPFIAMNCDLWCDYSLEKLKLPKGKFGHLVLVNNPNFKQNGDFSLRQGNLIPREEKSYTFSGIGIYHPDILIGFKRQNFGLAEVFNDRIKYQLMSGEIHASTWSDVGTPERLAELQIPQAFVES
jgi:MurNAc alpha-1-phosphate uridylyltransferase